MQMTTDILNCSVKLKTVHRIEMSCIFSNVPFQPQNWCAEHILTLPLDVLCLLPHKSVNSHK